MATNLAAPSRTTPFLRTTRPFFLFPLEQSFSFSTTTTRRRLIGGGFSIRAAGDGADKSYLDMWKNAVDRQKKTVEFESIAGLLPGDGGDSDGDENDNMDVSKKNEDFQKILEVSKEERDRIQRMQVIDRASAAIAAARAILKAKRPVDDDDDDENATVNYGGEGSLVESKQEDSKSGDIGITVSQTESSRSAVPGPDFWSWTPPPDSNRSSNDAGFLISFQKSKYVCTLSQNLLRLLKFSPPETCETAAARLTFSTSRRPPHV